MELQTISHESKFPNEYIGAIFIQIDQYLKNLLKKYKGVPILWNTGSIPKQGSIQYAVTSAASPGPS